MKKSLIITLFLSTTIILNCFSENLVDSVDPKNLEVKLEKINQKEELVPFSFTDRSLLDLINFFMEKKNINIMLPQGNNAIRPDQVVTFKPTGRETLPLSEAWELFKTFLEFSGYALIFKENLYTIVKTDDKISKEVLPLYIVTPANIPDTQDRIRYVYYFSNLKLSDAAVATPISTILKEMLSPNAVALPEEKSNAIILTDKADMIKSVMRIIGELDISGFKETIEVIPLFYATASDVKKLFDDLKLASGPDVKANPFLRSDPKADSSTYFPTGTIIQADTRTNTIIAMGRETAVYRIREFIQEHVDVAPEEGSSILHVYDLQYLKADEFAKTLNAIVSRQASVSEGGQSAGAASAIGGPERFFNQVIIRGETLVEIKKPEPTIASTLTVEQAKGLSGQVYSGGNRLIVAALKDDWLRIKALIEQLDKPEPQVIIEVFIVDFSLIDTKMIAGDSRNKLNCGIDNGVDYLASHISPVSTVLAPTSNTLATDLLQIINPTGVVNYVNTNNPGAMLISFNDPCTGIMGLLEILDSKIHAKVLSHPYIVTLNNQQATITLSTIRRLLGDPFTGGGGVPTTPIVDVNATLQVQILPRISSLDRVSLEIGVDINEFTSTDPQNGNRITRYVGTNANLNTGQILVLGGLTKLTDLDAITETPILSRVPILGWFFQNKTLTKQKENLAVFIAPTIVEPKLRGGLNAYTTDKVREGRAQVSDELLFDNFRDPITRFFFMEKDTSDNFITRYLSRTTNAPDMEILKRKRVRKTRRPLKEEVHHEIDIPQMDKADQVKALLALEQNPISSIKNAKS